MNSKNQSDIPILNHSIGRLTAPVVVTLHRIVYDPVTLLNAAVVFTGHHNDTLLVSLLSNLLTTKQQPTLTLLNLYLTRLH